MKDLQTRSLAWRGIVAAVVGGASLIGSALVAHADDVANNVDATVDATAELMTLDAGGPSGTTLLHILPTNGDGKNGCNLTGSTTLVAAVSSSSPGVATVSPSSVTFDACGATPQLAVTPLSAGSTTISLNETSNTSDGTFNLAPATFTVTVKATTPANTPPTVGVSGVTHGETYQFGSVPAAVCSVTDKEDGDSSFPATLSGSGLGSQTATCSYTDAGGLKASASATYSIVDTLAPEITFDSRTPAANEHGWNNSDVTVSWTCDAAGGTAVVAETVTATVSDEGANQPATGTCTDLAGNSASATVSGINIDKTAPAVTGSQDPEANANGWNNTDVTITFACEDGLSGVALAPAPVTLSAEGKDQSATGNCTDKAGNSASATVSGVNIDKTAPAVTGSRAPAANAKGWNNTDVTVTWTCDGGLSGLQSVTGPVTLSGEGKDQSATGTCEDRAGNTASVTVKDINIDRTAPSITWNGGPAADGQYYFGSVPAAPTCSATDPLSGVDGVCSFDGYKDTVGTHTMTAVAKDLAGNTTTVQRKYNVLAWTLKGFYQPVDMGPVLNTVKGGSTVPFKFEVFAGSTELTDPSIASFAAKLVACPGTSLPSDDVEFTTTGATSLRYDSTAGQFIQNWQTPKKPGSCYVVTMTTDDGSALSANFKLK